MLRVAVVLVSGLGCWSSPRPAAPRRETVIDLAVQQVTLANGLRLVVVPERGAADVSVTIRYGAGSADDPAGREGLAHLAEHVTFEHVRDGAALFDVLERDALGFTGMTTSDATVFQARGQLEPLLALEQARLASPCDQIPEVAFVRQREIVRNELREREADDRIAHALRAGVVGDVRAPASSATVGAITRAEVCAFTAAHYVPSNAVLVVSGPLALPEVQALVERAFGDLPPGSAPRHAPVTGTRPAALDVPTDRPWFVLSWPLPASASDRGKVRAVATMALALIRTRINGIVTSLELGAGDARWIAFAIAPSSEISFERALDQTKNSLSDLSPWFKSGLYEHANQRAGYALAESLDRSGARDVRFADEVARAGTLRPADDLRALLAMSRDEARALLDRHLAPGKANVLRLRPHAFATTTGDLVPSFQEQRRRLVEDPQAAQQPAKLVGLDTYDRAQSRTLANGLAVHYLPLSTSPTVDIRLVIPAGAADEPAKERGIATLAAHALHPPFDAEMFHFAQTGGIVVRDVGLDATQFAASGFASNLDVLLSGLGATVLEGGYDVDDVREEVADAKLVAHDSAVTRAWAAALHGDDHPYRGVGRIDGAATELAALERFRKLRYRPQGATLIVAGNFDIAVAERWIQHVFGAWSGAPPARRGARATLRPFAFAEERAGAQVTLRIALAPATDDEPTLEIVADMIEQAMADVREALAASYGLRATVSYRRLGTTIELDGAVDATRAGEALRLLRARLAKLRERSDETASLFVAARRHVLAGRSIADTRASALADAAAGEVAMGRARWSRERAATLTLERVMPVLDTLDLARAAIVMTGPEAALRAGYAALGREPTFLE